jgi:hypothetical protein
MHHQPMSRKEGGLWILLGVLWLGSIGVGGARLWTYKTTPGAAADHQPVWPAASRIPRDGARPTLVMMAHPQCSCTRASVGELENLMQRLRGRMAARVVFVVPRGAARSWTESDTWRTVRSTPGVTSWLDEGGIEAARFGARTSGQVFLFAVDGRLLFSGGITPLRGHLGDSAGQEKIVSLVTTGRADGAAGATSRVFGCALGPV